MSSSSQSRPDIPADHIFDFDVYNVPGAEEDIQLAFYSIQQRAPDIFWTPRNGGHWVATRTDDIKTIQSDHARFSHEPALSIPPVYSADRNYPLQIDPPAHRIFRAPLVEALQPKIIEALIPKIRITANELIDAFKGRGSCDYVSEFAAVLPIVMFLDLVDLPRSDRALLLRLARDPIRGETVEIKASAFQALAEYLLPWVEKRRMHPGDDLISRMVNVEVNGTKISLAEAVTFTRTVVLGGLDTVTGVLSFIMRFFATHPDHRRTFAEKAESDAFLRRATEELLRRHGLVNTTRVVTHDFEYKGAAFRKGDMVMLPNLLVGLDDRRIANPLEVDFDRPSPPPMHAMFDFGPHTCVGATLARTEIRICLAEWFKAIPDFTIEPGTRPSMATGMVNGVLSLNLAW